MFEQYVPCLSEDGEDQHLVSPMDVAIEAAHRFLRTKIRDTAETKSGKRDGVGVVRRVLKCDAWIVCILLDIIAFNIIVLMQIMFILYQITKIVAVWV